MKIKLEQIFIILFIISIPFIIYFGVSTKSQLTIKGTVVDFGATTDDTGIHSFLMVKLENNRTIKIDYQLASGLNIGKKVLVNERTTKLFDMKKYKIIKWYK
ncbi:hypothetical protein [Sulfurimonas sp.]|uniref:hypothetical protein n=1 Tax=Sulfurimonas sp. TaxID=2022749 RepID=UPI002B46BDC3|nr:hypothetical protein [Sulfurimonas sp.]